MRNPTTPSWRSSKTAITVVIVSTAPAVETVAPPFRLLIHEGATCNVDAHKTYGMTTDATARAIGLASRMGCQTYATIVSPVITTPRRTPCGSTPLGSPQSSGTNSASPSAPTIEYKSTTCAPRWSPECTANHRVMVAERSTKAQLLPAIHRRNSHLQM